jgi:hypothetical protein
VFGKVPEEFVAYGTLELCADWCGLGYKLRFLRKVEVDVATLCCYNCSGGRALVKLCKVIWSPAAAKLDVTVVPSEVRADYSLSVATGQDIDKLNGLLKCLRADTADLRRYAQQLVTLRLDVRWESGKPGLHPDYIGYVEFGYQSRDREAGHNSIHRLRLADDLSMLHLQRFLPRGPTLLDLPSKVRLQIFRNVLIQQKGVFLDLSTGERTARCQRIRGR